MDNKEKIIEVFLEVMEENEWFKQYISIEEARRLLNENVTEVVENAEMQVSAFIACYDIIDKKVSFSKSVDIQNMTSEAKLVSVHELLHALTRNIELDDKKVGEGFTGINYVKTYERIRWGKADIDFFDMGRGLNEGITEWLAEKLTGEKVKPRDNNIYDSNGNLINTNAYDGKNIITINDLSDDTINCFLSIEDKDFFNHNYILA